MAAGVVIPLSETHQSAQQVPAFLTEHELLAVLRIARKQHTRDWCMILLAYGHGLRTEEICALRTSDIRNGVLSVQRRKRSLKTSQPLLRNESEPLLDEVAAMDRWLRERPQDDSGVLFTSRNGGELHRSQFFRVFQRIAEQAGLPLAKRNPRILKYSLAAHLLASGVDIFRVTEILGHRSLHSTLRYARAARRIAEPSEFALVASLWRESAAGAAREARGL